jgi:hypothetical protein
LHAVGEVVCEVEVGKQGKHANGSVIETFGDG